MDVKITPNKLSGILTAPPSKSISHRMLICQAFSDGTSKVENLLESVDITATISALNALGANINQNKNAADITGINTSDASNKAIINCYESGSTLRFMLPIAAVLGCNTTFYGEGKLPERPITPYIEQFPNHGVDFISTKMPYEIKGKLTAGTFTLAGDISSQFISGLLLALPLAEGDSEIVLSTPLQSKPYVDITLDCMKKSGVSVTETESGYKIKGNQKYKAFNSVVEADMSQAAFFLVANCLGSDIKLTNLSKNSVQGDSKIQTLTENFKNHREKIIIDATHIPDLVPILTVMSCFESVTTEIIGCKRLRIKECDRLAAISGELNKIGGKISITDKDTLIIKPVKEFTGGICSSWNDHRIPMCIAIAATRSNKPVVIENAECVAKSYPRFFDDYKALGGIVDVI